MWIFFGRNIMAVLNILPLWCLQLNTGCGWLLIVSFVSIREINFSSIINFDVIFHGKLINNSCLWNPPDWIPLNLSRKNFYPNFEDQIAIIEKFNNKSAGGEIISISISPLNIKFIKNISVMLKLWHHFFLHNLSIAIISQRIIKI